MAKAKSRRKDLPGETVHPSPVSRSDGELYKRPDGDSPEWLDGYEDGFENRPERTSIGTIKQIRDYVDGYAAGKEDREEIDRSGSSNT